MKIPLLQTSSVSEKYIPRLADCLQKSSDAKGLVPSEWNIIDVAQFLRVNDCATYCDNFSKRKVDGKTLLNLTKDQIIDLTGFKVGPSLKIYDRFTGEQVAYLYVVTFFFTFLNNFFPFLLL